MRTVLILISLLTSYSAIACYSPRGGAKYDSLIKIQKLEKKNHYRISVPTFIEKGLNEAQITLAYSSGGSGGIPLNEKNITLKTTTKNNQSLAEFIVEKKEKQPYLVIMWWHEIPGMCGVQANTSYLEVK